MNTDKATKKRITSFILIICCLLSLCSCYKEPVIEKSDSKIHINEYIVDLIGVELMPYMYQAEMEVEKGTYEFAYIKITLSYNTSKAVTKLLKEKTHVDDSPEVTIPAYKNHPFAAELKAEDMVLTGHYIWVKQEKLVDTRDINIYTTQKNNYYYVFIFG